MEDGSRASTSALHGIWDVDVVQWVPLRHSMDPRRTDYGMGLTRSRLHRYHSDSGRDIVWPYSCGILPGIGQSLGPAALGSVSRWRPTRSPDNFSRWAPSNPKSRPRIVEPQGGGLVEPAVLVGIWVIPVGSKLGSTWRWGQNQTVHDLVLRHLPVDATVRAHSLLD